MYGSDGVGIPERQYYCVDADGNIIHKRKSLVGSLFHEFTHCLHHIGDGMRYCVYSGEDSLSDDSPSFQKLWSTREELRTISGYVAADCYTASGIYDPICDNCFELYESISKGDQCFPRVGHIGYRSDLPDKDKENIEELQKYITFNKKVVEHWKGYLIA
jgi:hypothetical protein